MLIHKTQESITKEPSIKQCIQIQLQKHLQLESKDCVQNTSIIHPQIARINTNEHPIKNALKSSYEHLQITNTPCTADQNWIKENVCENLALFIHKMSTLSINALKSN